MKLVMRNVSKRIKMYIVPHQYVKVCKFPIIPEWYTAATANSTFQQTRTLNFNSFN